MSSFPTCKECGGSYWVCQWVHTEEERDKWVCSFMSILMFWCRKAILMQRRGGGYIWRRSWAGSMYYRTQEQVMWGYVESFLRKGITMNFPPELTGNRHAQERPDE